MQFIAKKLTSLTLAAALAFGAAVTTAAAPAAVPYQASVTGKTLSLTKNGKAVASYALKSADVSLTTSTQSGSLLVCFTDSTGKSRAIALGKQTSLVLGGKLNSLAIQKALEDNVAITLGTTADIAKVTVDSPNSVTVSGKVAAMTLSAAAKVSVKAGATVSKATKTDKNASVTAQKGATVATPVTAAKTTTTKTTAKTTTSSTIKLHIDPMEGDEKDRLMDLVDELNDSVYAYDSKTDEVIDGKCTWNNSRYAELEDDDRSYSFTFTPDDDSLAPIKGSIKIYVDGAFGDITLHYDQSYIDAKDGDDLGDLKNELKDIVTAYDDNGDEVKGTVKWDSSNSTKVRNRSYGFTFKPSKGSRYDSEDGSIEVRVS